jgi:hypothetical protein
MIDSSPPATPRAPGPREALRRTGLALLAGVLLAGGLLPLAPNDDFARAAPGALSGTLKLVVEHDRDADARSDLAPTGDSPGDEVMDAAPVFASDNRTRLGRAMFLSTFQADQGALVAGALRLRSGTITLAGARVNGAGSLAVTGGTGTYAGARGTYTESATPLAVQGEDGPARHRVTIRFTR